jgi:hypothetical protein
MIPASMGSPRCRRPGIRSDGSYESICLFVCLSYGRSKRIFSGGRPLLLGKGCFFRIPSIRLYHPRPDWCTTFESGQTVDMTLKDGADRQNYQAMKKSMCFCTLSQIRNLCNMRNSNLTISADCLQYHRPRVA